MEKMHYISIAIILHESACFSIFSSVRKICTQLFIRTCVYRKKKKNSPSQHPLIKFVSLFFWLINCRNIGTCTKDVGRFVTDVRIVMCTVKAGHTHTHLKLNCRIVPVILLHQFYGFYVALCFYKPSRSITLAASVRSWAPVHSWCSTAVC